MRLVLVMVLAGLVALPFGASAQAGEEGATSEPSAQEPAPSSEPTPEEPAQPTQPTPSRLERGHLDPFAEPEDFVPPLQRCRNSRVCLCHYPGHWCSSGLAQIRYQ